MPYKTQSPNFGASGNPETFNETEWPNSRVQIGYVFERGIKRWQAFKIVDAAVASALGKVLYIKNYASYEATPTIGNSTRNEPAGVSEYNGTLALNSFAWLRQGGLCAVVAEAATFAKGDSAIAFSANNSVTKVAAGTASTYKPLGIAQAVESAGFVSVALDISPL